MDRAYPICNRTFFYGPHVWRKGVNKFCREFNHEYDNLNLKDVESNLRFLAQKFLQVKHKM